MLKLANLVFSTKFLINSIYFNKKNLNLFFLKFYFLLTQKEKFNKNYFFFNFFFYKKLWISFNCFSKNFFYNTPSKKFYKKYFFINKKNFAYYNYNIKNDSIFFFKSNKNFIIKDNPFFLKILNLKLISLFFYFTKVFYFFNFYFNFFFINYFNNLNNKKNTWYTGTDLNFNNNHNKLVFKSIRYCSHISLLQFNKVL